MKIGIVGCGSIGQTVAKALDNGTVKGELAAVCDNVQEQVNALVKMLKKYKPAALDMDGLIQRVDLVVEAASAAVMPQVVRKCLEVGKDVLVLSIGGFLGNEGLLELAEGKNSRIYLPSGAIVGIDGVKAAAVGGIKSVTLTTTKPPAGLAGSVYVREKGINLNDLKDPVVLFEGNAAEAVKWFPANLNVSAVLSLAGLGKEKTWVKVVADPAVRRNIHEVEVTGEFGRFVTRTENVPFEDNPRTSYLGPLAAIATLKRITDTIQVGS